MENVKFECKLETVDRGQVVISLFKGSGEQLQEGANDELLMHLSAEVPVQGEEKVQEAEFIVVVDRWVSKILRFYSGTDLKPQEWLNAGHTVETSARGTLQDAGADKGPREH